MKFRSLLPGESRAFGPGGHPDPAELTGGDAPPCAEPPVAPTFFGVFFAHFSFSLSVSFDIWLSLSRPRPNHIFGPYPIIKLLFIY